MSKPKIQLIKLKALADSERTKSGKKKVHYSNGLKNYIIELHSAGYSPRDLSDYSGISSISIRTWIRRNKNSDRPSFRKLSVEQREDSSLKIYFPNGSFLEGLTFKDILEILNHEMAS